MLGGQDFSGSHQTSLIAIIQSYQHGHQRHQRLPTPYITLQESVHLPSTTHVLANLLNNALLGVGQLKGQILGIKRIEHIPYPFKTEAPIFLLTFFGVTKNVQLDIKEFLKLQSVLRLAKQFGILRKMNVA